jgi:DTW domain-containing protein YfiP
MPVVGLALVIREPPPLREGCREEVSRVRGMMLDLVSAPEPVRQPVSRSAPHHQRCARCVLHMRLCLCTTVQPIDLATRVVVLRHRRELHKPTNTGRLVPLTLSNGEVRTIGARGETFDTAYMVDPSRRTLVLYPMADSRPLTLDDVDDRPITLIVPDADWRRAHKLVLREPALHGIARVHLPSGPPSSYRLRRHTDPRFLATFEAIARALGILEGLAVRAHLEHVFRLMVERTLWSRGQLPTERVTGGIPALRPD